jgi:hypothetical protein
MSAPLVHASANAGYFRPGRWLADVRTVAAMGRYLLEPETGLPLNPAGQTPPLRRGSLAQPSKPLSGAPKVRSWLPVIR